MSDNSKARVGEGPSPCPRRRKELAWQVGHAPAAEAAPAQWVPAAVPGAVQLDWARAAGWEPYIIADNYKQYGWMEDCYWRYSALLEPQQLAAGERLYIVSQGIDYAFAIMLGGVVLLEQEGMFTPIELDITAWAQGGELQVILAPAPKRPGIAPGRSQASQSCKPAVSYGWDWHPRLIPLGIWDDTYVEIRPATYIQAAEASYRLADGLGQAHVRLQAQLAGAGQAGLELRWRLADPQGQDIWNLVLPINSTHNIEAEMALEAPQLWWPNGHGAPHLYTSTVELWHAGALIDRTRDRIGFRTIQLTMHPGAWEQPQAFPKSRSVPPITLEVNGQAIFCKGTNWVNPEIFPGTITSATYEPLLQMAQAAHMNLLRCWGGAIVNKASFFAQCDELGLMVWQEFPLACNDYAGTPPYLRILDQESRAIIMRLRKHACLAIWCGGNELFNAWSGMTDQSLALRLLNANCYHLDPGRPFLMTSPLMGMAHGHYKFYDADLQEEVYAWMRRASNTAYTEFGVPGPPSAAYLASFIPSEQLFPPRRGTAWEDHHAFGVWQHEDWLNLETLERYFGPIADLESLVAYGQWLQCEGYKCIYEEARRQKPVCAMALNWCYNEPWPTAANNSLISWPDIPKPAYYAVQASCRPVLASAALAKFSWAGGELFQAQLWLLNDTLQPLPAGMMAAVVRVGDGEERLVLEWHYGAVAPNGNLPGPALAYQLPVCAGEELVLELRCTGAADGRYDSQYRLHYRAVVHPVEEVVVAERRLNL